jgi:enediyne core biosynthesis thioesterase
MRAYEYTHIVGFEETNLVGNVYYANHVRWQGRCREMFLRDHAPEILDELRNGLYLVTVRVSCEYFNELFALDRVIIRMTIGDITQSRITMLFEYIRPEQKGETLIARGEQQIACMHKADGGMLPAKIPLSLRSALDLYMGD